MPAGRSAQTAAAGLRGFDVNAPVNDATARAFVAAGYTFVVRYLGRVQQGPNDLSANEVDTLLDQTSYVSGLD